MFDVGMYILWNDSTERQIYSSLKSGFHYYYYLLLLLYCRLAFVSFRSNCNSGTALEYSSAHVQLQWLLWTLIDPPEIFSHCMLGMDRFLTGLGGYYELENVC